MRLTIISDTHLRRGELPFSAACQAHLREADLIVHAGDFSRIEVLEQLASIAPVAAVHGNVDDDALRERLPESCLIRAAGVEIAVIHDAGPARGRLTRLRRCFPEAAAVIFGHSHLPCTSRTRAAFRSSTPAARPSAAGPRRTRWASPR
ncbi:MAG: metallophosphoesterase family protein [Solirubrobacteraceae bacterium]